MHSIMVRTRRGKQFQQIGRERGLQRFRSCFGGDHCFRPIRFVPAMLVIITYPRPTLFYLHPYPLYIAAKARNVCATTVQNRLGAHASVDAIDLTKFTSIVKRDLRREVLPHLSPN
jgi:hypothetical protein